MTEVVKSGKQSAARKAARERAVAQAAEFRRREAALEELAVEYFVAIDGIAEIEAEAARQIAAVRARANAKTTMARREATTLMNRMTAQGVTRSEVAKRLGIAVREVAKAPAESGNAARQSDSQAAEGDAAHGATAATQEHVAELTTAQ